MLTEAHTLGHFYAFDWLAKHSSQSLLDKLISLYAKVHYVGTLDT